MFEDILSIVTSWAGRIGALAMVAVLVMMAVTIVYVTFVAMMWSIVHVRIALMG